MNLNAWWASLRIARRDALRHKARSALVIAMLGLPIVGVVAFDVVSHSAKLSTAERVDRQLGSADAVITLVSPNQSIEQPPDGSSTQQTDNPDGKASNPDGKASEASITAAQLRALLPPASQLASVSAPQSAFVRRPGGPVSFATQLKLDYTDPLTGGLFRTLDGRAPHGTDEIVVTKALAARTGASVGDVLIFRVQTGDNTPAKAQTYRVVGTVANRYNSRALIAIGLPDDPASPSAADLISTARQYYVKSPRPITWADVLRLNKIGFSIVARSVAEHPPPRSQVTFYKDYGAGSHWDVNSTTATTIGVVIVMCLLEIVLLAGPAFAVGARSQRRQLGIVVASGGEPRHTRNVVLGGGVILGLLGGLIGAGLGIATGLVLRTWAISKGSDFGGLHLHWWEIVGIALVSLITGVLAAILPARAAAKQDVVGALAGRRPDVAIRKRTPILGVLTVAAGVGLTCYGAVRGITSPALAIGAAVGEIGLVACTPALVGLVGQLATHLPLASRLALRDATRNRGRTAPAVAAIMAAVAGTVAAGIYMTSTDVAQRQSYTPSLRPGLAEVTGFDTATTPAQAQNYAAALDGVLPFRSAAVVGTPDCYDEKCVHFQAVRPASQMCPELPAQPTATDMQRWRGDVRCAPDIPGSFFGGLVIGGPDLLRTIVGHDDPAAASVLLAGGAITFDSRLLDGGRITIAGDSVSVRAGDTSPMIPSPLTPASVPGAFVHAVNAPSVLLSPAAAEAIGAHYGVQGVVLDTTRMPTRAEEGRADDILARVGDTQGLYVERGYQGRLDTELLLLVIAAGLVTFGAAGAATGLAIADARPDHVTLAAIGASPATRRRLAMSTAGIIALLGAILGSASGFVPAIGILYQRHNVAWRAIDSISFGPGTGFSSSAGRTNSVIVSIPWLWIAAVLVAVPALAGMFAAVFTRSQRVLARRIV